ncbi:hypothetical protein D3C87_1746050 [compost metagenome]
MSRGEALTELAKPLYDPSELEIDLDYFCKKLRISRAEYDSLLSAPSHRYTDFPTWDRRYEFLKSARGVAERLLGRRIKTYS